jgi:NAD(P)-dependent dehydrogenase (short-subunit alcohol dehydrogenase family)
VRFAERGDTVYATLRDPGGAGALKEATANAGTVVEVLRLDVTEEQSVRAAFDEILQRSGRVDVLVNNAGVLRMCPWEQMPVNEVEQVFQTNLFGSVRCAQAVLPTMRAQRSGAIINVASIAGRIGAPIQGPYCASKFAMLAFTESLAVEVSGYGIKVRALLPGFVATRMLDTSFVGYEPDEQDPYNDLQRRWSMVYAQARQMASDPKLMADAVSDAVDDPDDWLFRLVGEDSKVFADGRSAMGDTGWIAYGKHQTDADWFERFARDFPLG